jgi:transcriptional regulator with XRE-family HTH domain
MANAEVAGDRIAQALKAAGMKPAELARRLHVSQPTVHGWVNQLHGITWANARRVAAVLKVAPGWIMFGADEEAERVAQTSEELGFLRLYRELDDLGQASVLRLLTAMQHPPPDTRPKVTDQPPFPPGDRKEKPDRASADCPPLRVVDAARR